MILKSGEEQNLLLKNLRALKNGRDRDNIAWYNPIWEKSLHPNKTGIIPRAELVWLWRKIKTNADHVAKAHGQSDPTRIAAEGYDAKTEAAWRLPNTWPGGVSNHVGGKALDVTILWRSGAKILDPKLGALTVTTGEAHTWTDKKTKKTHYADPGSIKIVNAFNLKRPVTTERWHFELK